MLQRLDRNIPFLLSSAFKINRKMTKYHERRLEEVSLVRKAALMLSTRLLDKLQWIEHKQELDFSTSLLDYSLG